MTCKPFERDHADAGFTLVEVLVTVTLMSLLTVLVLGTLRFGMTAWRSGIDHADDAAQILLLHTQLRRLIEDAYPLYVLDAEGTGQIDFDGQATSLRFLAAAPMAFGGAGRFRYEIFLDRRPDRADLILAAGPELSTGNEMRNRHPLLNDVASLGLSYYGQKSSERNASWHGEWRNQMTLPQAIRIRVDLHPGDRRQWADLVVAPRIGADVGCLYDPLTRRCRGR